MFGEIKLQRRQPVLTVDDQKLGGRILQLADRLLPFERAKIEHVAGKQQNCAWDRRLRDRHFVEILERAHLSARKLPLKGGVGAFNAGDELGDFIVLRHRLRRNLLILVVITADKSHFAEDFLRRVTG